ncbi:MAG: zf-HC2 domain-containing protein [Syntrophobacter sp.]
MKCKNVLSRLSTYLDRELSPKTVLEMEKHLAVCRSCRGQLERIRQAEDSLNSLAIPPLPRGFAARVMAEARSRASLTKEKKPLSPFAWHPLRWFSEISVSMRLAACATVLLACLLGTFMSKEVCLSGNRQTAPTGAERLDGLEWFNASPPASLGSAYLTLTLTAPEEQGERR